MDWLGAPPAVAASPPPSPMLAVPPPPPATQIDVSEVSFSGYPFLKISINTPGNIAFTTLRLSLQTANIIESSAALAYNFLGTDSLFPLQAGTGTFKQGASSWLGYSVTLNTAPPGFTGFTIVLSTGQSNPSPATFFMLLTAAAQPVQSSDPVDHQLADASTPSNLMTTPSVLWIPPPPPAIPSPPPPPAAPPPQTCVCGIDPASYSTFGNAMACFGANDVTNLEYMFANLPLSAEANAFYTRCSDYDGNGAFQANDLTDIKRYYANLLPIASYIITNPQGGG